MPTKRKATRSKAASKDVILNGRPDLLTPRQVEMTELLNSEARHICLPGGSRSGKTVAIVRTIILRGLQAPSRHAIMRLHAAAVWPSIGLQTLPFVARTFFPDLRIVPHSADRFFSLPNDSELWLGGLDDKERVDKILGNEYATILLNECSQIPYSSVLTALTRLAQTAKNPDTSLALQQKAFYDLNPPGKGHWTNILFGEHRDPVSKKPLANPDQYRWLFSKPADNAEHLDPAYLQSLDDMPDRARRRFRDGVYGDETESALWTWKLLEETRVEPSRLPRMQRVVVAVDPSGAKNELDSAHDEIGIMVAGLGMDGRGYVLDDCSLLGGPNQWGSAAVAAYHHWQADAIVGETNFGGAMVEYVIQTVDASVPFKAVTASRGKAQRAEPIATLYQRKQVSHAGRFEKLEDELTEFTDQGYIGARSPNRADAAVWGLTDLMLGPNAAGWLEYYRAHTPKPPQAPAVPAIPQESVVPTNPVAALPARPTDPPPPPDTVRLIAKGPYAAYFVPDPAGGSQRFMADATGMLTVPVAFVPALERAGCRRPS